MLKVFMRFVLWGVIGLVMLIGAIIGTYYYFVLGKQLDVPELVAEVVWQETGALAYFDDYHFGLGSDFPFISLKLDNVVLRDSAYADHGMELLRVKKLGVNFRPWKLLWGDLVIKSVEVDSAKVQLYRSAEGRLNLVRPKREDISVGGKESALPSTFFSIDMIKVNGLDFEFLDSLRRKDYHVDLGQTLIHFSSDRRADLIRLRGRWFFEGLTFKMDAGSFVTNRIADVDLLIGIDRETKQVRFHPSHLAIDSNDYAVEGTLTPGKPAYLRLLISGAAIDYKDALLMLNKKVRHGLRHFAVSSPVAFQMHLEGPMRPGRPLPLSLDFSFENADFSYKNTRFTETAVRGKFINDCDPSGIIDPHSGCLTLTSFAGKLAGVVPVTARAEIRDMEDLQLSGDARVETPLAEISGFLPPDKFQAHRGMALVDIHYEGKPSRIDRLTTDDFPDVLRGKLRIVDGELSFRDPDLQLSNIDAEMALDPRELRIGRLNLLINKDSFQLKGKVEEMIAFIVDPDRQLNAELDIWSSQVTVDHFLTKGETGEKRLRKRTATTADNHFARIIDRAFSMFQAELSIRSRRISYQSLQATDVRMIARLENQCADMDGGCMVVDTFQAIVYGGIPVYASLSLRNPDDPVLALDARIRADLPAVEGLVPADKLSFRQGEVDIDLHYQGRLEDYLNLNQAALNARLEGRVQLRNVGLDYLPQGYQLDKLNGALSFDERDLIIDSLDLTINKTAVFMQGDFHRFIPFLFDPDSTLVANLKIRTPNLDFANFPRRKKIPEKSGAARDLTKQPTVSHTIEEMLNRIVGKLDVNAGELHFRGFDAKKVQFRADFLDNCAGLQGDQGCVIIDDFSAILFNNAPLTASLKIENLTDPFFTVEASSQMPLEDLNTMFPKNRFHFLGGSAAVDFCYAGKPHHHFDGIHQALNAELEGKARLEGASFDVVSKGYQFRKLDADLVFDNENLDIRSIKLELNNNALRANGKINHFIPFLLMPKQQLSATLDIDAEEIDFGNFSAPKNFENIEADSTHKPTVITGVVENALNKVEADLRLSAKQVKYESFQAENIRGAFLMNPERMVLNKVRMDIAEGIFYIDGRIGGLDLNTPKIDVNTSFDHVNVSEFFAAFDNFGQDDLTSENIRGHLTAVITFSGQANSNYDLLRDSMQGRLDLEITDGELLNLPALERIHNFFSRNRNLSEVEFATLQNTFFLDGEHLELSQFKIFSSVLAILVEGRYCLNDNEHTDLLVSVPLTNLWKKNIPAERLEEFRTGKRRGIRILLRAHKKEDGMKITPMLSRKAFQKDLEE